MIAVLCVVLEFEVEVEWVLQSIAEHLVAQLEAQIEIVVLWVMLEVDWVVQSMVVQVEIAFFTVADLF